MILMLSFERDGVVGGLEGCRLLLQMFIISIPSYGIDTST